MNFIFDPSLALYLPLYQLDGGSFKSRDAYGHLCTVTGALWRPNGCYFDGADDKIALGSFGSIENITIEGWFNASAAGTIVSHGGSWATSDIDWYLFAGTPAKFAVYRYTGVVTISSTINTTDSEWHHIAAIISGTTGSISVDGEKPKTATVQAYQVRTDTMQVGESPGGGDDYTNLIGELRIYNRALTPLEIQHNYLATKWRYR